MRQPESAVRQCLKFAGRAGLGVLGGGLLIGAVAPAASAATAQNEGSAASRIDQVKLYPFAGTGVDPLSNSVGTNVAGIPVSTSPVNSVFADGLPASDLPVVGTMLAGAQGADAQPAAAAPAAVAPAALVPAALVPAVNAAAPATPPGRGPR